MDFWDTVNRQDWHVCELTQKGVGSRGFSRGRYTANEHTVHRFDRMVCEAYLGTLGARGGAGAGGHDEPDRDQVARAERLA